MTVKTTLSAVALAGFAIAAYAGDSDVDALKKELEQLKQDNAEKIRELEQRLEAAEVDVEDTVEANRELAVALSQQFNRPAANTFNPGVGVVLNGKYLSRTGDDDGFSLPGFFLGEEPGPGEAGFSLGESELNLSANIDDKFFGSVTLSFGEETEVEEAYVQTIALPDGLGLRFGRFFSNVGYLNSQHSHADDFAGRPLAQQAFLGNNLGDDGIQLRWLAPTSVYWESGIELYRGESFPSAGADHQGQGTTTAFSHIGGDIGSSQSWRAGVSLVKADVEERSSADGELFSGDSDLVIADFVWKWAPAGNFRNTYATVQGEYYRRREQGRFTDGDGVGQPVDSRQRGWYLQGVYQFMPQWRIGLRQEQLEADDLAASFVDSVLDNRNHKPQQTSLMVDWTNSEFSRVRLQYSHDQSSPGSVGLWTLQYIVALGAHGAHAF